MTKYISSHDDLRRCSKISKANYLRIIMLSTKQTQMTNHSSASHSSLFCRWKLRHGPTKMVRILCRTTNVDFS